MLDNRVYKVNQCLTNFLTLEEFVSEALVLENLTSCVWVDSGFTITNKLNRVEIYEVL